ncbi:tetratricopeptide repeat protein [Tenacibaculum dicentrarchi]|uniref:type IX secretion system periplasmic lipoprotein PorW/SprE n=1 Tax=Tenacibaculum dicentrarchi TaxID=669041 RepID=UPI003F7F196B
MNKLSKILVFNLLLATVYSCSVKKDAFLNRNFHALTTKYNVLFNGEQAYLKGLEEVSAKHKDNFWKPLQIEPITFEADKIILPVLQPGSGFDMSDVDQEEEVLTMFDKAEEKAVKAIQKHSMNINGYEKNRQIDDAYLLLGKSRYYTQRFVPAIEAFNYIIANYPNASLINETKVWRAKTNIRLDNEKLAIESLKFLLEVEENEAELPDVIKEQAHTAMAMAYQKTDTIQKVIEHLTAASKIFKNKEQAGRNMFVLGQIYSELNYKDSARAVFKKLSETRKAPHKYRIRASIEMAKNTPNDSASIVVLSKLKKLIRNSDNRKFLNALYYQAGVLELGRNKTDNAIDYFKKSIKAKHNNDYQKTYAYQRLGAIAFDKQKYVLAGAYYDSVLTVTPKEFINEKRIRRIRRKNKGLTRLREYENLVTTNDSILKLVAMPITERTSFFEKYIEKIKKEDQDKKQLLLNAQNFGSSFGTSSGINTTSNKGKWYFYNMQVLAFGKANFQKVWGTRPLEDNWRLSDKSSKNNERDDDAILTKPEVNLRYELSTYLNEIPSDKKIITSLIESRNDALYQLGLIYKEQFKNNNLAIKNLARAQKEQLKKQDSSLELPISYHLYQLYRLENNVAKAGYYKNIILTKYAPTTFAEIIRNPTKKVVANKKEDALLNRYKEIYYLYKENKFEQVIKQVEAVSLTVKESILIPKFLFLKALAIGKQENKEAYIKALEFIAIRYADRAEGLKAIEILEKLKK